MQKYIFYFRRNFPHGQKEEIIIIIEVHYSHQKEQKCNLGAFLLPLLSCGIGFLLYTSSLPITRKMKGPKTIKCSSKDSINS